MDKLREELEELRSTYNIVHYDMVDAYDAGNYGELRSLQKRESRLHKKNIRILKELGIHVYLSEDERRDAIKGAIHVAEYGSKKGVKRYKSVVVENGYGMRERLASKKFYNPDD